MKQILHEELSRIFGIALAFCLGISLMAGMFISITPQPLTTEELNSYKTYALSSFEEELDGNDSNSDLIAEKSGNTVSVYNKEKPLSEAVMFIFDEDGNLSRTKTGNLNPYAIYNFPQMVLKLLLLAIGISIVLTVIITCATWIAGRL